MANININEFVIEELKAEETVQMLELRNSEFPSYSLDEWNAFHSTAVIAKKDGKFRGCIPLQFREFKINSKVSISIVFENAVLSHKEMRGVGLGTAMMDTAAGFLEDRVDAMCVMRGEERSPGYRFYRKTGHGVLCYRTFMTIDKPRECTQHYEIQDWKETIPYDDQLRKLYNGMYEEFGGYWVREPGYYEEIVNLHVLRHLPSKVIIAQEEDGISGYLVTNRSQHRVSIYDLAVKAGKADILTKLIETAEAYACQEELPLGFEVNREHPLYRPVLDYGFKGSYNTSNIMARILRGDRIFAKLAQGSSLLDNLKLTVRTPHRDVVLSDPASPEVEGFLYMKESQLGRLLFCRLDLVHAVRTDLIRMSPLPQEVEDELGKIFTFSPWVYFGMDYV